jgi:adenosylcobinamide kinase / adenosylcobinamide-phosphate guanylyltransferase
MAVTLVTGPVRSGKSDRAMSIARSGGRRVTYIATARRDTTDPEWESRLERHSRERPAGWETIECAAMSHVELVAIFREAAGDRCLIVDSLGTWLDACMAGDVSAFERDVPEFEARLDSRATELARAMLQSRAQIIAVAEEVGWDVVPAYASARVFRDVLGRMKQLLASGGAVVLLVVCGLAIDLRALGYGCADAEAAGDAEGAGEDVAEAPGAGDGV